MIGKTVNHYRLLEKLGEGGMGVVYKAEDTRLLRTVALKFLPRDLAGNLDDKARFIREARTASALQHNNICTIHEIDETEDGHMFMSTDYYSGETLQERIAKGPITPEEAVDLVSQIAAGLAEAHEDGIVHRDIKPANVIVTEKTGAWRKIRRGDIEARSSWKAPLVVVSPEKSVRRSLR